MKPGTDHTRLAQSASALGAGLLGFGIGAKWGLAMNSTILLIVLIVGAVIHVAGMYVMQMKSTKRRGTVARLLWMSAWICLLALIALFIYMAVV
jgi:NADH:ubiquinone oxidoreductase subunit 6 (subunit J)